MTGPGELGRTYGDGEVVFRQGEVGECLYVVQDGSVEIVDERGGGETVLRVAGPGELIGEMAIFEREVRSATVRARGPVRILTVDKRNFLKRINEDPTLAFRIVETMSRRVRELSEKVVDLKRALAASGGSA
jgi:CRP-like cAMP-binding protein